MFRIGRGSDIHNAQLGANIKATSAGFAFGIDRIVTSAECSEVLSNWKCRDQ
jgi:hypothetical protein